MSPRPLGPDCRDDKHHAYTPTTDEVRDAYAIGAAGQAEYSGNGIPDDEDGEFDRWLAAHDAETLARVQPSREEVVSILIRFCVETYHPDYGVGLFTTCSPEITDAILALLPGRTEADVKAEAWDEAIEEAMEQGTIQVPDNPYREKEADRG